ncbi:MAG: hypothetical protein ACR2JW_15815 [Thermomicrobiales bacterium]
MKYITGFFQFWYDFIVGDDWTVAAGVIVALAITALLAHNNIAAWWLMPLAIALMLTESLWRVARTK